MFTADEVNWTELKLDWPLETDVNESTQLAYMTRRRHDCISCWLAAAKLERLVPR